MAASNQNFTAYAGETLSITVTVTDDSTGAVVDLTGATISWVMKSATATILSKSVGSGITVSAPTTGVFVLALTAANTTGLSGNYRHECRVTLASGEVKTVFIGSATFNPTLTA